MKAFEVSVKPLGDFCRVRVDGLENAKWLLNQLSQAFVFKTFAPFDETADSTICSFMIPYNSPLTRSKFERMLSAIPQVRLTSLPE